MSYRKGFEPTYIPLRPGQELRAKSNDPPPEFQPKHGWRPFWMRRSVVLLFLILFAVLLAALEVLHAFDVKYDGLATTNISFHYLWTYGPTAILTLFLALWNRVDYRVRQMTPWIILHRASSVTASRSILLDYISPTIPEILWTSVKNHDFAVTASTLIVNLLTLLIIVSTSLLTLAPRPNTLTDMPYQTSLKFITDGSKLNIAQPIFGSIIDAIETLNLSYPLGTTPEYAYQPFQLGDVNVSSNSVQEATVEVLMFDFSECKEADLAMNLSYSWLPCPYNYTDVTDYDTPTPYISVNLTTPNCTTEIGAYYQYGKDGDTNYFASYDVIQCEQGSAFDNRDVRVTMLFGEAKQNGDAGPRPDQCLTNPPKAQIEVLRSKQWQCKPSLSSLPGNVSFNATNMLKGDLPRITLDTTAQAKSYENISYWNLAWQTLWAGSADFRDELQLKIVGMPEMQGVESRLLRFLGPESADSLLTTNLWLDLATAFYKQALSLTTHAQLTAQDQSTVKGTVTEFRNRLKIRTVPLRIMQALLGSMILFCLFLALSLPGRSVTPCDPAQLGGITEIMAQSAMLTHLFSQTGKLHMRDLQNVYGQHQYRSNFVKTQFEGSPESDHHFVVENVLSSQNEQSQNAAGFLRWWRPLIVALLSRITAFCAVIGVIAILQILLAFSERNQGLAEVSSGSNISLIWAIFPAIIMVIVSIYFRSLNSVYKLFAPYCLLRVGSDAKRTMVRNYLSMTEVEVLLHALRDRQTAVFLSTCSVILAAFLTIAVSGIFTATSVPTIFNATLSQQSWFSGIASDDNGTVGNNGPISGLILQNNLSYPQWTYENLALASFNTGPSSHALANNGTDARIRTTVPAIRTALNCTLYDLADVKNFAYYSALGGPGQHGIWGQTLGATEACTGNSTAQSHLTGSGGAGSSFTWYAFINNTTPGCPLLNFYWGWQDVDPNSTTSVHNLTYMKGLACYESIEQVNTNVNFGYPSLQIDTETLPIALEDTARPFSDVINTVPYYTMPEFQQSSYNGANFWSAAINRFGITDDDFKTPQADGAIIEALKYSQGVVRAQQYHAVLRTTNDIASAPFATVTGTVTDSRAYRLVMNKASTIVLTCLLAGVLICATVAGLLMSTKNILPKNPLSIGAMVSLLADSNLFEKSIDGDKPTNPTGAGSTIYKMGWFPGRRDGERVFTINQVGNEADTFDEIADYDQRLGGDSDWEIQNFEGRHEPRDYMQAGGREFAMDPNGIEMPLRTRPGPSSAMRRGFSMLSP